MSMRIHRGVRFAPKDFSKLHARIQEWRGEVRSLAEARMARVLARRACAIADRHALGLRQEDEDGANLARGRSPLSVAWRDVDDRRREIEKTRRRDPEVDLDFDISVMVHHRSFYAIVHTERREWFEAFLAKPWVEDYSYSDAACRPEHVPQAEWDRRGRTWNAILARSGVPADQCYSVTAVPQWMPFPDESLVEAAIRTPEDRVGGWAEDALLRKIPFDPNASMGEIVRVHSRFRDWLETKEGAAALAAERPRILERLQVLTCASLREELERPAETAADVSDGDDVPTPAL